jgi:shikimate kinase
MYHLIGYAIYVGLSGEGPSIFVIIV